MIQSLSGLRHLSSGKVREIYEVPPDRLLLVATDRVSVFDVILPDLVPDKGRVLTALSAFWFEHTNRIISNHVISCDPADMPEVAKEVAGRAMLVHAAIPVRMECVVRGYLFGSAWTEYRTSGTINGDPAPSGLRQAERLPEPRFTPSTKAEVGSHDVALSKSEAVSLVGNELYEKLRSASLGLYESGRRHAENRGVILADTKFEFGICEGDVMVIDEMMTPDSSRYWPVSQWRPGSAPPSYDKQYVRDFMDAMGWDHEPPAPHLSFEAITRTRDTYVEVYEVLSGRSFQEWY